MMSGVNNFNDFFPENQLTKIWMNTAVSPSPSIGEDLSSPHCPMGINTHADDKLNYTTVNHKPCKRSMADYTIQAMPHTHTQTDRHTIKWASSLFD